MRVIILVPTSKIEIKDVANVSDNLGCLFKGSKSVPK